MTSLPGWLRAVLDEPAVPDPPRRVWRDWALVAATASSAVLEAVFRTDPEWAAVAPIWKSVLLVTLLATLPLLMIRRQRPLLATVGGFSATIVVHAVVSWIEGAPGGLITSAVMLIPLYAACRWASGRDALIASGVGVLAGIIGIVTDPGTVGEAIGGFIVLSIPVEAGLLVRYRAAARRRAIAEAQSRERVELARELHDTVAHHVSAIAVQAQAGQALAATQPERALEVLGVIEEAASRTLREMRAMVGTLRAGTGAELAPQQGVADLERLVRDAPGPVPVELRVADDLGPVGPATDAALFRIAQESLTNAFRHARRASRVRVRVWPDGEIVRLVVSDDGEHANGSRADGFGLLGMAERAHLLGGELRAGPAEGRGWLVSVELPRGVS